MGQMIITIIITRITITIIMILLIVTTRRTIFELYIFRKFYGPRMGISGFHAFYEDIL